MIIVKYVGGKTRLLKKIDAHIPSRIKNGEPVTWIEPFVGGGAVLLHALRKYNVERAIVNDTQPFLNMLYKVVQNNLDEFLDLVDVHADTFNSIEDHEDKKKWFVELRTELSSVWKNPVHIDIKTIAGWYALTVTSFGGILRTRKDGGLDCHLNGERDKHFKLTYRKELTQVHELLQGVEIRCVDFTEMFYPDIKNAFYYLDPPYINSSPMYGVKPFDSRTPDLVGFLDKICDAGQEFLLSNEDCPDAHEAFKKFNIDVIEFNRALMRGRNTLLGGATKCTELLITNYELPVENDLCKMLEEIP